MIKRKISAAALTMSMYPIILGFILNPYGEKSFTPFSLFFLDSISYSVTYWIFSSPIILLYGGFTSWISDWISLKVTSKWKRNNAFHLFSFVLHLLFGSVLGKISLIAAFLFFVMDRLIEWKVKKITWLKTLLFSLVPILVFLIVLFLSRLKG
ncbi:hypothetical protein [Mangrovibacillus cuniculi]|uniref:Uncharacterized protein n=1 Tax=Mangrovibacillus cuniculi TaxID=2593652 RepID=A0A7S8C9L9_9BACI|nr:hypothetical protein [Mangrovibacillus cuniculi]QPC45914.1 hypothetical protein G8O30_02550 [Mangrovibacillus cuniculi]